MAARHKLADMRSRIISAERRQLIYAAGLVRQPRELYREACEDDDGNRYTVVVWQPYPGLSLTDYTLEDGTPVKFIDGCQFEIASSGTTIYRCL
jgi:hypothetical protein